QRGTVFVLRVAAKENRHMFGGDPQAGCQAGVKLLDRLGEEFAMILILRQAADDKRPPCLRVDGILGERMLVGSPCTREENRDEDDGLQPIQSSRHSIVTSA